MFVTSTKEINNDSLIRADFTGSFLILTRIDLAYGLPSVVQFRCSSYYLMDIIEHLDSLDGVKVLDNNYDPAIILQDRQHIKSLIVAGQVLEFYSLPALRDVLLDVYNQYMEAE